MDISATTTLTWNDINLHIPGEAIALYSWGGESAPHAANVYFGDGSSHGRPWADYVIDDEENILEGLLQQSLVPYDVEQTFVNFAFSLGFAFQDAIEAPIWFWPNNTQRSDGTIVGSPRDIVDTGALRDSQSIELIGV